MPRSIKDAPLFSSLPSFLPSHPALVYVLNSRSWFFADDRMTFKALVALHLRPPVDRIGGAPINDLESELMAAVIPFLPANEREREGGGEAEGKRRERERGGAEGTRPKAKSNLLSPRSTPKAFLSVDMWMSLALPCGTSPVAARTKQNPVQVVEKSARGGGA